MDLRTRTKSAMSCAVYVRIFDKQLHPEEEKLILSQSGEDGKYTMFFIIWSLKEAFVKAIGQGLGFDLQSLYFTVEYEECGPEGANCVTEDEEAGASGCGAFQSGSSMAPLWPSGTAKCVVIGAFASSHWTRVTCSL